MITKRDLLRGGAMLPIGLAASSAGATAIGANWTALERGYRRPEWFRDAKLGLWAHWGAQCVPEQGDWYARRMYLQGDSAYEHHLKTYGHPSKVGFMQMYHRWTAAKWEPEALVARFKQAGARYFVSMANHHDNFDHYDSRYHSWNSLRVGPKRDIVGTWEKAARAAGMRFGVSNHSAHAWHFYQPAYSYDAEGPMAGVRYDAFTLRKAAGKGQWWEGLDPQELYTGPSIVAPDGIATTKAMLDWQGRNTGHWPEDIPWQNPGFAKRWLLRQNDLVDKYRPDLVYFDDTRLPFNQLGLDAVAHYYNKALDWHGSTDVVVNAKLLFPWQKTFLTEDVERGFSETLRPEPWQTCTCIGAWHYDRSIYENKAYKTPEDIVQRLCDIVSKNGNLLLSIPQRGDGTIDSEEEKFLDGLTAWMAVNGGAIHGTRPWRIFGEGPTRRSEGVQNEGSAKPFTAQDIRFTVDRKAGVLNAFVLDWPEETVRIASLGKDALPGATIVRVELIGGGALAFRHESGALSVEVPKRGPTRFVPAIRIIGTGLI